MRDIQRFIIKIHVNLDTKCWEWTASTNKGGYGNFTSSDRQYTKAHIFAYEYFKGKIPEGLELDHLCRVRHCVNPDHLEAVNHLTNMTRALNFRELSHRKTHCKRGHEFTFENTYHSPKGHRDCYTCRRMRDKKRQITGEDKEE